MYHRTCYYFLFPPLLNAALESELIAHRLTFPSNPKARSITVGSPSPRSLFSTFNVVKSSKTSHWGMCKIPGNCRFRCNLMQWDSLLKDHFDQPLLCICAAAISTTCTLDLFLWSLRPLDRDNVHRNLLSVVVVLFFLYIILQCSCGDDLIRGSNQGAPHRRPRLLQCWSWWSCALCVGYMYVPLPYVYLCRAQVNNRNCITNGFVDRYCT